MPTKELEKALNQQIVNELGASNAYLMIAGFMDSLGLKILAQHFFKQSDEERGHALKILRYLLDVGCAPKIAAIPAVSGQFKTVEEAVKSALDQEIEVTGQINNLMEMAHKAKDYASVSFLRWFVDEQVEEVSSMNDLLLLVKRAGPSNMLAVEDRLLRGPSLGAAAPEE